MAFHWWADDGSLLVLYGSFVLPSSTKKIKINVVSVTFGPPLTKLSGSAHAFSVYRGFMFGPCFVMQYLLSFFLGGGGGGVQSSFWEQEDWDWLLNFIYHMTSSVEVNKIDKPSNSRSSSVLLTRIHTVMWIWICCMID